MIARRAALAFPALLLAPRVGAQGWAPTRPIRFVLPLASGGSLDALARLIGVRVSLLLGQPVVVEPRPGAGGNIAFEYVARAAPDGHTILVGWDSLVINPTLYGSVRYDPVADFVPIVQTIGAPQVLVVRADGARDLAALVAMAKAGRPPLNWASPGNGSIGHMTGELFRAAAALPDFAHIPYRGAAPAIVDLLAGNVHALWVSLPAAAEHLREGRLRALVLTSAARSSVLATVPTAREAGYADLVIVSWQGLLAPAGTSVPAIATLNAAVNAALDSEELRVWIAAQGSERVGGAPEVLATQIRADLPRWAEVVRRSGARPD
ncbi:tripartite tricarboxylate transporter substrate binding protein [Siccirubricoccus sp. G192]|uniref:Bug family tripartite tricarboxylate transporter substrate binding protein n=1 Tax=Siccirubricoccus sp. G192 TaxID=2849651 RepID=UPI001C2C56AB|nr:tripartite tricarboxylate transporter substrate-binding protein [Siccirubricoccus sp. G192]MBV1796627.1 tripartite tricarboxylate transporter substrate binding protein [Siccirubricoccus sp. G192]